MMDNFSMKRTELVAYRAALRDGLARLESIKPSCVNCVHSEGVHCTKFEAVPPNDVQAAGCDEWQWDGVPF